MARTGSGTRRPNPTGGAVADPHGDRPARSDATEDVNPVGRSRDRLVVTGLAGFLLVIAAVILEAVSGSYANSPLPGWADWAPLAWPQPLRVLWWLAVAAAAAGFRWSLGRLGMRTSRVVTAMTVGPFVAFAVGIATGAEWATWH